LLEFFLCAPDVQNVGLAAIFTVRRDTYVLLSAFGPANFVGTFRQSQRYCCHHKILGLSRGRHWACNRW